METEIGFQLVFGDVRGADYWLDMKYNNVNFLAHLDSGHCVVFAITALALEEHYNAFFGYEELLNTYFQNRDSIQAIAQGMFLNHHFSANAEAPHYIIYSQDIPCWLVE